MRERSTNWLNMRKGIFAREIGWNTLCNQRQVIDFMCETVGLSSIDSDLSPA